MGFGSDGASVMTGHDSGVGAVIKCSNPYLISIHCFAHRLALTSSQATEQVNTISPLSEVFVSYLWLLLIFKCAC